MKLQKLAGATSEIWQVFIRDSSSTTGAGLTGLAFNTASLTAYYHRDTDTTATVITLVTMTVGTFTSSGFKEIDATNMPGWYQFCPPNAALASGSKSCGFHLKGATNMAPLPIEVQLVSVNPDNATTFGLTNLDAAVTSRMATYTQPTGFLAATFPSGTVANTTNITAGTITTVSAVTGLTASNLDTTVSSRMATYTQPTGFLAATFPSGTVANTTNITAGTVTTATNLTTNNDKTGYALTSGERNSISDAFLDRDMSTGADSGSTTIRTPRQALRFLRNKWDITAGTLTVTKENDSTTSWTSTVTTDALASPVIANDPAGP